MAVEKTLLEFLRNMVMGAGADKAREYVEPKIRDAITEFNRPEQPMTPGATMIDGYPSMSSGNAAVTTPYSPSGMRNVEGDTLNDDQMNALLESISMQDMNPAGQKAFDDTNTANIVNNKEQTLDFVRQYGSPVMSNAQKMLVKDVPPEVAQDPEMQKGAVALSSTQAIAASADQEPGFFESAGNFFKDLFGDEERMTRLALAFNSMRYQPDAQLANVLGDRLKTLSAQRGHNATLLSWQKSDNPKAKKALDYYQATKDMKGAAKIAFGTDTTYGTTPRLVINPKTGEREWMVLGTDGTPKKVELPEGMEVPPNVEKVETATDIFFYDMASGQLLGSRSKDIGKGVIEKGMAESWLESISGGQKTIDNLTQGISAIDWVLNPERKDTLDRAFGITGKYLPTVIPETEDLYSKLNQIGAKQFLAGFESLKGGGQISNIEGGQAKQAGLALFDEEGKIKTGLSPDYVREQLKLLREIYQRGVDRAERGYRVKPGYNPAIHSELDYLEQIKGSKSSAPAAAPAAPTNPYAGFSIAR